jgi:type I restriction enzyme S subunit
MNNSWPRVKLGEVIGQRKDFVRIDDLCTYKRCRVQLHAKGIVLRDLVTGSELKTKEQQICRPGDFLVAEIDAKVGGYGIVPDELDGAIVSSHYFLFEVDRTRLNRNFLGYFIKTPDFFDQVSARGTTNYAAIRPSHVLEYQIPLPPFEEQRRIVVKIDELAAKIKEASTLQQQAEAKGERLLISMAHGHDLNGEAKERENWKWVSLGEVLLYVDDSHRVEAERTYPNFGIYSFGRGLFKKQPIDGALTSATTLRRVKRGQFVYSRLFAFEGAYGMVTDDYDGFFVSNEYPTFDCDQSRIRVEFLWAHFKSPAVWKEVAAGSKGLGDRRQRVQPTQLLSYRFWLPPLEWQNRIAEVQTQVDALKPLQRETAAELDALLPSVLDKAFKGELATAHSRA